MLTVEHIRPEIDRVTAPLGPRRSANDYVLGDVLVEPCILGLEDGDWWRSLCETLKPSTILVTHWHSDHFRGAWSLISSTTNLSLLGPAYEGNGLDPRYPCLSHSVLREGDCVGEWTVIATPGHSETHICFWNGRDLIAGDMIQDEGDVLIPKRGGNLADYIRSLSTGSMATSNLQCNPGQHCNTDIDCNFLGLPVGPVPPNVCVGGICVGPG